jgi:hypothetical protein
MSPNLIRYMDKAKDTKGIVVQTVGDFLADREK